MVRTTCIRTSTSCRSLVLSAQEAARRLSCKQLKAKLCQMLGKKTRAILNQPICPTGRGHLRSAQMACPRDQNAARGQAQASLLAGRAPNWQTYSSPTCVREPTKPADLFAMASEPSESLNWRSERPTLASPKSHHKKGRQRLASPLADSSSCMARAAWQMLSSLSAINESDSAQDGRSR